MKRKAVFCILVWVFFATAICVRAQQTGKSSLIGIIVPGTAASYGARIAAFKQSLQQLGYVEGQSVNIEYRYADGKFERVGDFATEMIQLKADVIVSGDTPAIQAIKKATSIVPVVMGNVADAVASGLVASLARPGGNITGFTTLAPELDEKRLEIVREMLPKGARVAFYWDPSSAGMKLRFTNVQAAAQLLRVSLQSLEVRDAKELQRSFEAVKRQRPGALMMPNTMVLAFGKEIAEFAVKNRLPIIYDTPEFIEQGGLMSYGPNFPDLWRRAAVYVDRILKGTKPSDLPVEQPMKFDLVISLKTAKQVGLTIPQWTLMKADRVIK